MEPSPEQKHARDLAATSPEAFEEWVRSNHSKIVAAAEVQVRKLIGHDQAELADDVTSGAICIALDYLRNGELLIRMGQARSLETWIRGVTYNLIRTARKHMGRHTSIHIDGNDIVSGINPDELEAFIDQPVQTEKITECLETLTPREKQIWQLIVDLDGERPPSTEIANILGCSKGSVDVHLHKGKGKLEKCLAMKGIKL